MTVDIFRVDTSKSCQTVRLARGWEVRGCLMHPKYRPRGNKQCQTRWNHRHDAYNDPRGSDTVLDRSSTRVVSIIERMHVWDAGPVMHNLCGALTIVIINSIICSFI